MHIFVILKWPLLYPAKSSEASFSFKIVCPSTSTQRIYALDRTTQLLLCVHNLSYIEPFLIVRPLHYLSSFFYSSLPPLLSRVNSSLMNIVWQNLGTWPQRWNGFEKQVLARYAGFVVFPVVILCGSAVHMIILVNGPWADISASLCGRGRFSTRVLSTWWSWRAAWSPQQPGSPSDCTAQRAPFPLICFAPEAWATRQKHLYIVTKQLGLNYYPIQWELGNIQQKLHQFTFQLGNAISKDSSPGTLSRKEKK